MGKLKIKEKLYSKYPFQLWKLTESSKIYYIIYYGRWYDLITSPLDNKKFSSLEVAEEYLKKAEKMHGENKWIIFRNNLPIQMFHIFCLSVIIWILIQLIVMAIKGV